MASAAKPKKQNSLVELVGIVVVALILALGIQAFLVKPFRIPSGSMEPTLQINQRVLVDRVSYRFTNPSRNDVVVFHPPKGAERDSENCGVEQPPGQACPSPTPGEADTNFIKRVVGLPGDRLKVIQGDVYINGKKQNEPFIRPSADCEFCDLPREITVPPGKYFMMGDNRGFSQDSRVWGPVPKGALIGHAFLTYWPPKRIGTL
ncbi:MAG: signal peptidase I [Thermoleophilaceae bacterium]|nr:signal peptidase I [Thermoleophilaceae bacterium]